MLISTGLFAVVLAQGDTGSLLGGAEGLFLMMVVLTAVAGWLDAAQQLKGGTSFPVPLVVYATMFPVITFVVVFMLLKGERPPLIHYAAVLSPLPLIVIPRLRRRKSG
ncbi:MAG: hypothetical protein AAF726_03630 [Planctomycetota bacterium]